MNTQNIVVKDTYDKEQQFRYLYKKHLDLTAYLTDEEKKVVEEGLQKYAEAAAEIRDAVDEQGRLESSLTRSGSSLRSRNSSSHREMEIEESASKEGSYRLSADLLYVGAIQNGEPSGKGVVVSIPTRTVIYEGEVLKGQYEGVGRRYLNGELYEEGTFRQGLIVEGIRYNANQTIYSGLFRNDLFDGNGRLVFPSGFFLEAIFEKGIASREVKIAYPNAQYPTKLDVKNNFTYLPTGISVMDSNNQLIFYYNGDIFCGITQNNNPKNGYFYRFWNNSFTPMQVGNAGREVISPRVSILEGGKYKTFSMGGKR